MCVGSRTRMCSRTVRLTELRLVFIWSLHGSSTHLAVRRGSLIYYACTEGCERNAPGCGLRCTSCLISLPTPPLPSPHTDKMSAADFSSALKLPESTSVLDARLSQEIKVVKHTRDFALARAKVDEEYSKKLSKLNSTFGKPSVPSSGRAHPLPAPRHHLVSPPPPARLLRADV